MNDAQITKIKNNPEYITLEDIEILDNLTSKYPYFQAGQLLLTKGLLNTNSNRYNNQLIL